MKKRMQLILAIILCLGATAAAADTMVEDADGDGVFSMDEMKVSYPELTEELFGTIDGNGDGAIDPDELAAAQDAGVLVAG